MSNPLSVSTGEFLSNMKDIVRNGPVDAQMADGTTIKAQYLQSFPPVFVIHFDSDTYSGSCRASEDGEGLLYRAVDATNFYRAMTTEVVSVRSLLDALLQKISPKAA